MNIPLIEVCTLINGSLVLVECFLFQAGHPVFFCPPSLHFNTLVDLVTKILPSWRIPKSPAPLQSYLVEALITWHWVQSQILPPLCPGGPNQEQARGKLNLSRIENYTVFCGSLQLVNGECISWYDGKLFAVAGLPP